MVPKALAAQDIWKTYDGRIDVLRGLNFELDRGEAVLVWGRNGSGKTTLLNILGGMDRPTKGRVFVLGREITSLPERQLARVRLSNVGFVFQDHNLIEEITVRQNVLLPLKLSRAKEAERRVEKLVELFDLRPLKDRKPSEISIGEAQRVAVARALANEPTVLLADEPTASLDASSASTVLDSLGRVRETGAALLIASHDPLAYDAVETRYELDGGLLRRL